MKKSCSFTFTRLPGGGCALLLAVALSGCETHPPAPYPGGRTEYLSSGNGRAGGSREEGASPSVHHRAPTPSERVAAPHPALSTARTQGGNSTPPKPKPTGVESEVQDPSDLKADDTPRQKKGGDKKPAPAKVDAETSNPSDLH